MARFTPPRSWQTTVLILVSVGVIALALGGYLTPLSRVILTPVFSIESWLYTRYQAVQRLLTEPDDVTSLQQRNAELEAEIARLQAEVIALQQQVADVNVLSTLLGFVQTHPENQYVSATVIQRDPSPFLHYVVINRGSDAGLRHGMPVVTSQGLVGRIAAVTATAARVQLINDAAALIDVRLQQSGAEAILVGDISGEISLQQIPQDVTVQPGDVVLTSGLGGAYPPNLLIGQVTGVRKRDYDLFQSASVQPLVDFRQLNIVLVITNFSPVDTTPLIPQSSGP